ncbi:MAG: hypothetical protein AB7K67_01040 [Hyphomicrobiaceae bacterium]
MADRVSRRGSAIVQARGDPDHPKGPWLRQHAVYLDGVRQAYAMSADVDAGEVRSLIMGSDGRPARRGTSFVVRTSKGTVRIAPIAALARAVP